MAATNLTGGGNQTLTFEELICSPTVVAATQQYSIYIAAVDFFLSITAFLGNALILVALYKESSLHPPSKLLFRCLATTDLFVGLVTQPFTATYWLSLFRKDLSLCRYAYDAVLITASSLVTVSLLTLTAISVDRLLALSLGLRYRQVVTLKRTYVVVISIWVASIVPAGLYHVDQRITYGSTYIVTPVCLLTSIFSYIKIFRDLKHHHNQVQDLVQQQASQQSPLNIARYRKAVYSGLWVKMTLVVCYLPYSMAIILMSNTSPSYFVATGITGALVYFNSSLNPFLYCWKISEVRQAVKETIRQALCCPLS